ncbi:DEAD/DEAH box helicase [Actinomadura sp. KC216]|uniref:DEAD/DEAH box helicase n=1 Tax=Actinomadura sp. KC216 TaxID=2530370 RepID=UPI0014044C76|nr:DEAD/DEAH box helicase [Actinomadura sp. KC216]
MLDEECAAEVQRRARGGLLAESDLRALLLVPIDGPGVSAARQTAMQCVVRAPHLAVSILSIHCQSAGFFPPTAKERRLETGTQNFAAQASVIAGENPVTGQWRCGPTKKVAHQRAHVDLLAELAGLREAIGTVLDRKLGGPPLGNPRVPRAREDPDPVDGLRGAPVAENAAPPRLRLRERPVATAWPLVRQALSHGADLVFDAGPVVGQATFLCTVPAAFGTDRAQPGFVSRPLLFPGGELTQFDCLRADVLEVTHALAGPPEPGWSDATRLWASVIRLALEMISNGRVVPSVAEARHPRDRQPAWQVGPITAELRERLNRSAEVLADLPRCLRLSGWAGEPIEDPANPVDAVCACVDAVADRFVPAPGFRYLLGPVPFAAPVDYTDPISPLQEWTDGVQEALDTEPVVPLILRISEPHTDGARRLRATLRLAALPDSPDTAVDAEQVWNRHSDFPGYSPDLARRVARTLRRAARAFPALRPLGAQPQPEAVLLHLSDAAALRGKAGQELERAGITVEWHKDWAADLSAQVVLGTGSPAPVGNGVFGLGEILDRRWQVTLDGVALTEDEMDALAAQALPCVRTHNRWVLLDEDIRQQLRNRRLPPITTREALLEVLSGRVTLDGVSYACTAADGLAELIEELRSSPDQTAMPPLSPELQNTTLYPYQQTALNWLNRLTARGFGALLADEMGIGKTITALAYHLCRQPLSLGPTLVLCPTGLIANWTREIQRRTPAVTKLISYAGPQRSLTGMDQGSIVLTSYALLRQDFEMLNAHFWGLIVADEAQKIKNPATATARLARALNARTRLALTGTAVENWGGELWSILDWCNPGLFGPRSQFIARYVRPIETSTDPDQAEAARQRVQKLLLPFVLRRVKTDPALNLPLPDKSHTTHTVALSKEQVSLLEGLLRDTQQQIRACPDGRRYGQLALHLILSSRKICNSPDHFTRENPAVIRANPDEAARRAPKLHQLLHQAREQGESALVFTNFTVLGRLLTAYLKARGHRTLRYDGSLSPRQQTAVLEEFTAREGQVLVLTPQKGGVGLNLPHANHVIHYDRSWNPALEAQANDRVHRIGQKRHVHIHYLISAGSIEERIAALLERKSGLVDAFMASGELDYTRLTETELIALCAVTPRP